MADDPSGAITATVAGPLRPPLLEVGYNYTWPFNRYGTSIGPRDINNDPPTGVNDATPVFRDTGVVPPNGSLARNLAILRDDLKIKKVRMFLMGNAFNYGKRPTAPTASGKFFFQAPKAAHDLFFDHFRQVLEIFRDNEMQIIPSLLDFGAFYPLGGGSGGGRTSILTSQRAVFIETVLKRMLRVSQEKEVAGTVFAWEVVNEPVWNTVTAPPFVERPHTTHKLADIDIAVMASFLDECIRVIKIEGFESTVGHRFFSDLKGSMPSGSLPQFHYYGRTSFIRQFAGVGDDDPIPRHADLASDPKTRNAFVGEIAVAPGGDKNQFDDEEPGEPWPECRNQDNDPSRAAFERLKLLARKGYKMAFVWPDRSDKEAAIVTRDELKLTPEAMSSVRKFTRGRFPNGVP